MKNSIQSELFIGKTDEVNEEKTIDVFYGDVTPLGSQQDIDPPGRACDVISYPILDPARIWTSLGSRGSRWRNRKMRVSRGTFADPSRSSRASGIRETTTFLPALVTPETVRVAET